MLAAEDLYFENFLLLMELPKLLFNCQNYPFNNQNPEKASVSGSDWTAKK